MHSGKHGTLTEKLLQAILDYSPACIIIAEAPSGKIIYINDAARKFRGITDAQLTDITMEEYILTWKEYSSEGIQLTGEQMPLGRALTHGTVIESEEILVELDNGEYRWALATAFPIRNDKGEIIAGIVIWLDITDYKNNTFSLQTAKDEIRKLRGILPICGHCNKIRDNNGHWLRLDTYISERSEARFSHGICPDCIKIHFPNP